MADNEIDLETLMKLAQVLKAKGKIDKIDMESKSFREALMKEVKVWKKGVKKEKDAWSKDINDEASAWGKAFKDAFF